MQYRNIDKSEHINDTFKKQYPTLSKSIEDVSIEIITIKDDTNIRNELRVSFKALVAFVIIFGIIGLVAFTIYIKF